MKLIFNAALLAAFGFVFLRWAILAATVVMMAGASGLRLAEEQSFEVGRVDEGAVVLSFERVGNARCIQGYEEGFRG